MKKRILIFKILLILGLTLNAVDLTTLDKYKLIEQDPNTANGQTRFYNVEEIPKNFELYKMKYRYKTSSSYNFYIFYYDFENNKYYDVRNLSYSKSKIPFLWFNGFEFYTKFDGTLNSIEGKYYSDNEKVAEIEIRKVKQRDYLYAVTLDYEESGWHFLYCEGNSLLSDNTFGLNKEKRLEQLFQIDRSEVYYNNRNILSVYSNDKFAITITNNKKFDIELELKTEINEKKIVPKALFDKDFFYLYSGTNIYDVNYNLVFIQQKNEEKVKIIERKYEWVENDGLLTLFAKIEFSDKKTGWIYLDSLSIF